MTDTTFSDFTGSWEHHSSNRRAQGSKRFIDAVSPSRGIFELRATNLIMLDGAVEMELVGVEVTSKTAVMTGTECKGGDILVARLPEAIMIYHYGYVVISLRLFKYTNWTFSTQTYARETNSPTSQTFVAPIDTVTSLPSLPVQRARRRIARALTFKFQQKIRIRARHSEQ